MVFIFALIGICLPRFAIFALWFFSDWFTGVFETKLWPILGFLFLPLATLWYSVVENLYQGEWNSLQIVIMVVAIIFDLGSAKRARD